MFADKCREISTNVLQNYEPTLLAEAKLKYEALKPDLEKAAYRGEFEYSFRTQKDYGKYLVDVLERDGFRVESIATVKYGGEFINCVYKITWDI